MGMRTQKYVPDYFKKEVLFDTWNHEVWRSYSCLTLSSMVGIVRTTSRCRLRSSRLRAAGLLLLCRLVEVEVLEGALESATRFSYDRTLLAALVDRWRPKTHTFHLPCGEMTPTLEEDVSLLMGLPCKGAAADNIHPLTGDEDVSRHLEMYLLWLFRWVMFTETNGNTVSRTIIPYARDVTDADLREVPQYSWGFVVLVAMYCSLCDTCTKTDNNSVIIGCPLLL
ncbi:protein MAIN-LIKE 2-like [Phragmites australis]|uniref:protein MAIN-LIKE 2-like n=1 Tax=Phragmites australis TaxID=29695 RepID=UPI002D76D9D9|nr:protein MAIN-LIKE 2-like [Phragmites australis]